MVGAEGIEPSTFCSQSRRAKPLRYAPMVESNPKIFSGSRPACLSASAGASSGDTAVGIAVVLPANAVKQPRPIFPEIFLDSTPGIT